MNLKIGVIKGDGIGPEIVTEAMKVIDKAAQIYGHTCEYMQLLMGGASIDVHGVLSVGMRRPRPGIGWNHRRDRRPVCFGSARN